MRRAKKVTIVAASVALAAGVVSVIGIANAATTAVAGIQIVRERRSGYLLFLAALNLTAMWAFFEVGAAP